MERSEDSLEFERLWRQVRREGELVPSKDQLDPKLFKSFLPSVAITEIDVEKGTFIVRLVGELVRGLMGFDSRGVDANSFLSKETLSGHLERQVAFHDHPCARLAHTAYTYEDVGATQIEQSFFPVFGGNGERLIYILIVPLNISHDNILHEKPIKRITNLREEVIDIGAGIPTFKHMLSAE